MKAILTVCGGCVLAAGSVAANQPLEHVLVTTGIHKKAAETALPVTVLTGEDLRREAAASIGATLDNQPGLSTASFGPGVGQPVIRGQSGPRVRVLENGLGSGDAAAVSPDHAFTVEPLLAEAIEVLRGPATLLYGSGAIGGVVNVIDNRIPAAVIDEPLLAAELRHDNASDGDTAVFKAEAGSELWAWHVDGLYREWNDVDIPGHSRSESDGHADHDEAHDEHEEEGSYGTIANSDGRDTQVTVGASRLWSDGHIGLSVTRMDSEYGIPAGAHVHHEEDEHGHDEHEHGGDEGVRIDMEQTRYNLAAQWRDPVSGWDELRYRLAYTDYEHTELEGGEAGTRFENDSWEQRLAMVHDTWRGWHGVIGLQWQQSDFSAVGDESFIPESDIQSIGIFLVEDYHWQAWTFELGLRLGHDSVDPEGSSAERFGTVSGSASALWQSRAGWQVGAAFSSSERGPAVEELFSNSGLLALDDCVVHGATGNCEIGDRTLDTERSNNLDVTVSLDFDPLQGFVTVFYNDFSDYIYAENRGGVVDEAEVLYYSQDGATFYGIEFEATLPFAMPGCSQCAFTVFGDAIDGDLERGGDVPRLPPLRVGARVNADYGPFGAWLSVLDAASQTEPGAHEAPTRGYTRWDAGLEYRLNAGGDGDILLFLRGKNLGDDQIRLSTSFLRDVAPEAGRSLEAGVRMQF